MKKIHLSIPKPCHENWEAMTPSDRGRFCTSCQKAVIDFTNMSDRQLAEFFKKPPATVCGRVHNDQLNRDIEIPKKRIPWVKYFFQFTWPAFVLFLKSCGMKENLQGKVNVEQMSPSEKAYSMISLGFVMPGQELLISDITTVDSSVQVQNEEIVTKGEIIGDTLIIENSDTIGTVVNTLVEDTEIVYKPMDTVVIQSYGATMGKIALTGAVSVCKTETMKQGKESVKPETEFHDEMQFKVYPNPVRIGSLLTVSFEGPGGFPDVMQIVSSSGQLIVSLKQNSKTTITNIQIPSNIVAGVYFLRLITENGETKTTKLIVTK